MFWGRGGGQGFKVIVEYLFLDILLLQVQHRPLLLVKELGGDKPDTAQASPVGDINVLKEMLVSQSINQSVNLSVYILLMVNGHTANESI